MKKLFVKICDKAAKATGDRPDSGAAWFTFDESGTTVDSGWAPHIGQARVQSGLGGPRPDLEKEHGQIRYIDGANLPYEEREAYEAAQAARALKER